MTEKMEPEEQQEQLLRQEYGWFYDQITEILFIHDLAHLAALGAPGDEYSVEVDAFLPHLPEIQSPIFLSQALYEVFVHMFSEEMMHHQRSAFDALAEDIWKAYQSWKSERV
jgi:hypothetical protein